MAPEYNLGLLDQGPSYKLRDEEYREQLYHRRKSCKSCNSTHDIRLSSFCLQEKVMEEEICATIKHETEQDWYLIRCH